MLLLLLLLLLPLLLPSTPPPTQPLSASFQCFLLQLENSVQFVRDYP
jgi:hypothetical protein